MPGHTISLDTVVARSDKAIGTEVHGEMVFMNPSRGEYCGLDSVGSAIWSKLDRPKTVRQLLSELGESYADPSARIERDLLVFLRQLLDIDLLVTEPPSLQVPTDDAS